MSAHVDVRAERGEILALERLDDAHIEMPEPLPAQAGLHLFIDTSVIELFIDSRYCVTRRFYSRTSGKPVVTLILPGQPRISRAQSFSLNSIWNT